MKLEEVLPAFREGKKIRRKGWCEHTCFHKNRIGWWLTSVGDALEDDWEVVEEYEEVEVWRWAVQPPEGLVAFITDAYYTAEEASASFKEMLIGRVEETKIVQRRPKS